MHWLHNSINLLQPHHRIESAHVISNNWINNPCGCQFGCICIHIGWKHKWVHYLYYAVALHIGFQIKLKINQFCFKIRDYCARLGEMSSTIGTKLIIDFGVVYHVDTPPFKFCPHSLKFRLIEDTLWLKFLISTEQRSRAFNQPVFSLIIFCFVINQFNWTLLKFFHSALTIQYNKHYELWLFILKQTAECSNSNKKSQSTWDICCALLWFILIGVPPRSKSTFCIS